MFGGRVPGVFQGREGQQCGCSRVKGGGAVVKGDLREVPVASFAGPKFTT